PGVSGSPVRTGEPAAGRARDGVIRPPARAADERTDQPGEEDGWVGERAQPGEEGQGNGPPVAALQEERGRNEQQHRVVLPEERRDDLAADDGRDVATGGVRPPP